MKRALIPLFMASIAIFPTTLLPQQKLTATNLPDFLARYDTNFGPLEVVFKDLANENLPLTDEAGQPLARRPFADRILAVTNLRQTARQFAAKPEDLVLACTVVIRTESLADDLFDLSQVAYDNDHEDLGNRLNTLRSLWKRTRNCWRITFLHSPLRSRTGCNSSKKKLMNCTRN